MLILGIDWDETNREKLDLHDLDPDDVEFLFDEGDPVFLEHPRSAERYIALGFVPDERFALVVFQYDKETRWVRVVTAYETTSETWWKRYAKTKGI